MFVGIEGASDCTPFPKTLRCHRRPLRQWHVNLIKWIYQSQSYSKNLKNKWWQFTVQVRRQIISARLLSQVHNFTCLTRRVETATEFERLCRRKSRESTEKTYVKLNAKAKKIPF